jgi:septin family protein
LHRKQLKKGFDFGILVVGDSGLGKSTLIKSLFLIDIYSNKETNMSGNFKLLMLKILVIKKAKNFFSKKKKVDKTTEIKAQTVELEEKGVKLRLTIVDTPGFGDSINSNEWLVINIFFVDRFLGFFFVN